MRERRRDAPQHEAPDAGLSSLGHYRRALPSWRYHLRQQALPLIRWETPYLAWLQLKLRSPALDSYFAITANLGTHTFFMVFLPILFWCGYSMFAKGLVHILALGVFWTGFVKDFYSLPRPLSPPLQRITMSGSAALEYGFPSTHSANAVSVAVYAVLLLYSPDNTWSFSAKTGIEVLVYFYAVSIVFGRLYCGMHGFADVAIGSIMGALISLLEFNWGPALDAYVRGSAWAAPVVVFIAIIIAVRIHPEPADDCPCFDDSVAFAGVCIGLEFGTWTLAHNFLTPAHDPASGGLEGASPPLWVYVVRIVLGILAIFVWRETMKRAMLRGLPHAFRLIESIGLSLPRRFFTPASEYQTVPPSQRMDNLIPAASDFPRMVESIRNPTSRGRAISVGPQSAADAYETLAYLERQRRDSIGSNTSAKPRIGTPRGKDGGELSIRGVQASGAEQAPMMSDIELRSPPGEAAAPTNAENADVEGFVSVDVDDEEEEREVFSHVVKPRVRYDVEVVTKLVVYTGIAWLAVAGCPILFELIGLSGV
ncbi:Dihydrosphingosine 1-phosphate phosphatase [Escovopsis weberi]|uniref:Dihydrosphingosine 1-phosphate phosphatase n=1 Tax=Escovopsis weberi TaxID=150374 RepID=A0A0M9VWJ2_ESCWE|nr:Dihydrosphingosine 1-phosphate phosphatase [Escovopsis weberi]